MPHSNSFSPLPTHPLGYPSTPDAFAQLLLHARFIHSATLSHRLVYSTFIGSRGDMGYMKGQERMRRIGGRIHNGRAWDTVRNGEGARPSNSQVIPSRSCMGGRLNFDHNALDLAEMLVYGLVDVAMALSVNERRPSPPKRAGRWLSCFPNVSSASDPSICLVLILCTSSHNSWSSSPSRPSSRRS
ncbi:hypothetical protein C368_01699 [Cryptococcus neoformans 125.91]|nr:hypothetical protein C368_01699 [Cryptococcus neoformans var. grubii 125.91]